MLPVKTYIIAEAGTGHVSRETGRRFFLAMEFIKAAAMARADAVKFQMFVPDEPLFCPLEGDDERMETRWRYSVIPLDRWRALQHFAHDLGIDLLWSAFQNEAVEWLRVLKPRYVKVASRAAATFPYSDIMVAPFIISQGMQLPSATGVTCFHLSCVSKYPTPLEEAGYTPGRDGLSDHSGTIWPGLDAIASRARFLEVHFKIPGADMGNDTPVCLTTDQLKLLTEARDAFARMHAA